MNRTIMSALLAIMLTLGCRAVAQSQTPAKVKAINPFNDATAAYNRNDYTTAITLLGPLVVQGNSDAQTALGVLYAQGNGVPQDYKEAARLYGLAAAQGNASAQYNLGTMYARGRGVEQDYVRARMWYILGANSRYKIASTNLDSVVKEMTPAQIAQAQEMARKCQASNFKQCD